MNHIHFLSDNRTLCDKPTRLGHDFIVMGTEPGAGSCRVCTDLLFSHNLAEYEREQRSTVFITPPAELEESEGNFYRGLFLGVLFSSVLWFIGFLILSMFVAGSVF